MSLPEISSREEWLAARMSLLAREKELTRARDALNADRRRLPMVRVDKAYAFEGHGGRVGLLDLFEGRRQLFLQHFMFDPSWDDGCPSCSAGADELAAGTFDHLHIRDTTFAAVSRAPLAKIEDFGRARAGASRGTRRSGATSTTTSTPRSTSRSHRSRSTTAPGSRSKPRPASLRSGRSRPSSRSRCLASAASSGTARASSTPTRCSPEAREEIGGAYGFLDLTALGRQEEWEEPKGRAENARGAMPNFAS